MRLDFLVLITVLAGLVLIASRFGLAGKRHLPAGIRLIIESGTPFILLGTLVGPHGLNLLSPQILHDLGAILVLGFGWIGFLYGTHFEWRRMKRFSGRLYLAGFAESSVSLTIVALCAWLAIPLLGRELRPDLRLVVALALGICAAGTAPAGVFLLTTTHRISRNLIQVLRFFAAVDDLPAVLVLGVVFAVMHPGVEASTLGAWQRLCLAVAVGLIVGMTTHLLLPRTGDERHNSLILLGMAALGAGSAGRLKLSALFVSIIAGAVFANISPRKEDVYGLMAAREHTLYAVFLLVGGAMFRLEGARVLSLLVPIYVLARAFGKVAGGFVGRQLFLRESRFSRRVGAGLLFQGGMPLVFAVHFEHALGPTATNLVMTTFVIAVLINDLIAIPLAVAALRKDAPERRAASGPKRPI